MQILNLTIGNPLDPTLINFLVDPDGTMHVTIMKKDGINVAASATVEKREAEELIRVLTHAYGVV